MIEKKEILDFASRFLNVVMNNGSAHEQESFFTLDNPVIHVIYSGETLTMQQQYDLHQAWPNETFEWGNFLITSLSSDPERVRAIGSIYWQAGDIKAVATDDWIIERQANGELKFVFFAITSMHSLPGAEHVEL